MGSGSVRVQVSWVRVRFGFEKQQGGQVRVRVRVQGSMNSNRTEPNLGTLLIGLYFQHPASETDLSLYGSLRKTLENVDLSNLSWWDPEVSMVISDGSFMVKKSGA